MAHLGVFVVDGVDTDEEDGDDHHHERNKTCDQGQVILCVEKHTKKTKKHKKNRTVAISVAILDTIDLSCIWISVYCSPSWINMKQREKKGGAYCTVYTLVKIIMIFDSTLTHRKTIQSNIPFVNMKCSQSCSNWNHQHLNIIHFEKDTIS